MYKDNGMTKNADIFKAIYNNNLFGIIVVDEKRSIKYINHRALEISGYMQEELLNIDIRKLYFSDEDYNNFGQQYQDNILSGKKVKTEQVFKHKSGKRIYCTVSGKAIDTSDPSDLTKGIVWIIEDISDIVKANNKLKQAHGELDAIFSNSMTGIIYFQKDRIVKRVNQRFVEIMGYDSPDEIVGKTVEMFHLSHEKFMEFEEKYYDQLINHSTNSIEYKMIRKNGDVIWVNTAGRAVDKSNLPDLDLGVVWTVEDITQRKMAEEKLEKLVSTDELTGLCNRRQFMKRFESELARQNRNAKPLSLLMLDIDCFKRVNDTYGHSIGDRVLSEFANICSGEFRISDIFARFGGEEFIVLLPDTDLDGAVRIAERLRRVTEEANLQGIPQITVSIGVLQISAENTMDDLLVEVDKKMYEAKAGGRNRVAY